MARYLSMSVVNGALQMLSDQSVIDACKNCGVTEADWKLLGGQRIWVGGDRPRIKRVFDAILYSTIDSIGVPRFSIPAEIGASAIALFVGNVNSWIACSWIGTFSSAEDLADYAGPADSVEGLERVTSSQLFSLVSEIKGNGLHYKFAENLKNKTGIFMPIGVVDENEKQKEIKK